MSPSLCERLGGIDAIRAVVDDFVARCAADGRINAKFARSDVPATGTPLPEAYRNAPPLAMA